MRMRGRNEDEGKKCVDAVVGKKKPGEENYFYSIFEVDECCNLEVLIHFGSETEEEG